jgi:hypothetical protein
VDEAGRASSSPDASATQLWMPKSLDPLARSSGAVRSEWVMPRPAVIQLSSPGRIASAVPSESGA